MTEHPLKPMVDRARTEPFFVGWAVDLYQRVYELSDPQIASELGCYEHHLPQLMLCRRPHRSESLFDDHVRAIAEYVPCNHESLWALLDECPHEDDE